MWWTEAEDQTLARLHPDHTMEKIATALGRSVDAVKQRARRLKISTPTPRWMPQDDQTMRQFYTTTAASAVAKMLGRTTGAVHVRARELGLTLLDPSRAPAGPEQERNQLRSRMRGINPWLTMSPEVAELCLLKGQITKQVRRMERRAASEKSEAT